MPRLTACEPKHTRSACSVLAERGGFEPPEPFSSSAFKAGAFVRSATVPTSTISGYASLSQERCQSGRMGCPAKALTLRGPWVQIPPSPPLRPTRSTCRSFGFSACASLSDPSNLARSEAESTAFLPEVLAAADLRHLPNHASGKLQRCRLRNSNVAV